MRQLNIHNRTFLQVNRANCDVQPVVDKDKLIEYILKYATKTEPRSKSFSEIFKGMVDRLRPTDGIRTLVQRVLLRTAGDRDYCAQEVCHHLLELPLLSSSRTFTHINLFGQRELHLAEQEVTIANAIDKYISRPSNSEFNNLSLFEFSRWYFMRAGEGRRHRKPTIVVIHPFIPDGENHPRREEYCRHYTDEYWILMTEEY